MQTQNLETTILLTKNPADFRNRQVRIRRDDTRVYVTPEGDEHNFGAMLGYRKQPKTAEEVKVALAGEGAVFANIGVSNSLRLRHEGEDYQIVLRQARKNAGFEDVVLKLVSGYIPSAKLASPVLAGLDEIAEEFLPFTWKGTVVSGTYDGKSLPRPFASVLEYDQETTFTLTPRAPSGHAVDTRTVVMCGKELPFNARVFYAPATNSAQLIVHYDLQLDLAQLSDDQHTDPKLNAGCIAHIRHAEEEPGAVLNTYLDKQPLLMGKVRNNRLTGEFYTFREGTFRSMDTPLSESFAPSDDGVITAKNISLPRYLSQK